MNFIFWWDLPHHHKNALLPGLGCGFVLEITLLKELGHHISDHDAINRTAILFLPYKEAISLDYCQFTGLWVQ